MDIDEPKLSPEPEHTFVRSALKGWALATVLAVTLSVAAFYTQIDALTTLAGALVIFGVVGIPVAILLYLLLERLRAYLDTRDGPA